MLVGEDWGWVWVGLGGCGGTYDDERPYDFSRRLDVGGDDLGNEVGCHAHDSDHGDEGEAADQEEGFGQRGGAIVWDGHLERVAWISFGLVSVGLFCMVVVVVVIPASGRSDLWDGDVVATIRSRRLLPCARKE